MAQEILLERRGAAGLREDMIRAEDAPPPLDTNGVSALGTDDVMHFTTGGIEQATHRMADLEAALGDRKFEKRGAKDVTGALDGTGVGADLVAGRYLFSCSTPPLVHPWHWKNAQHAERIAARGASPHGAH